MAAGRYGEGNGRRWGSVDSMEKPKVVTRRFDSTPSRRGRGLDGGARRGNANRAGGGGSGGRWKTAGLTDRVGPPISEGEAMGRLGRKGREEVGHGWAGKGGRRSGRNCCSG
jgi:hypothetical protein